MTHVLIVGQTESGKTTLAKRMIPAYRRVGIASLVLDPHNDDWGADFQTTDPDHFLEVARRSMSCACFVDESGQSVGRYNTEMQWLATAARHWGHKSHFLTQRPAQIAVTVRDQCSHLYCFCISSDDGKLLANEFPKAPRLREANTFERLHYLYVGRFTTPREGVVTFA